MSESCVIKEKIRNNFHVHSNFCVWYTVLETMSPEQSFLWGVEGGGVGK